MFAPMSHPASPYTVADSSTPARVKSSAFVLRLAVWAWYSLGMTTNGRHSAPQPMTRDEIDAALRPIVRDILPFLDDNRFATLAENVADSRGIRAAGPDDGDEAFGRYLDVEDELERRVIELLRDELGLTD